jgi:phosphoribosylanthranilate isomerase
MNPWIKICGNTSTEDALLAAEAGADALGFVFASSPRQVTAEQVARIIPRLPIAVEKIGVFVDSTFDEINAVIRECMLTGVQLHFESNPDLPAKLRERLGSNLRILRVLHYSTSIAGRVATLAGDTNIDALLVDSRTASAAGGTGTAFDWNSAASLFRSSGPSLRLVVAGGLTPENVSEAITTLHPWGIDVVSGVEAIPGRKDPQKVRMLIARARAAHELAKSSKTLAPTRSVTS